MKYLVTLLLAMLLCPAGMEAKKKAKKAEVPQLANFPSTATDGQLLRGGDVVLRVRLTLPDDAKNASEGERKDRLKQLAQRLNAVSPVVYLRNYVLNTEKVRPLTFSDDGTIHTTLHVPYAMYVYAHPFGDIYMCPGDTVDITMDAGKKSREESVRMGGTGLSGEVNRLPPEIDKRYIPRQSRYTTSNADSLMAWRNEQLARIDSMVMRMNEGLPELKDCSPQASDIIRSYILASHLEKVASPYQWFCESAGLFQASAKQDLTAFCRSYFDFLAPREKYLTNNPVLMITANDIFFNRLEFTALRPISHGFLIGHEQALQQVCDVLHLDKGDFTSQVCMLRAVFYELNTPGFYNNDNDQRAEAMASVMPHITNPALARQAVLAYRDFVKQTEAVTAEDKPMTKGDSIFQRIVEPYKGNVLSVDFWEMSCGPCRAGMLREREAVEQLKDKSIRFLYVTDDEPDKCNKWMDENNIRGEHIFITRAEWGLLQEKFNFSGIPFHVYVDKAGKVRTEIDRFSYQQLLNE